MYDVIEPLVTYMDNLSIIRLRMTSKDLFTVIPMYTEWDTLIRNTRIDTAISIIGKSPRVFRSYIEVERLAWDVQFQLCMVQMTLFLIVDLTKFYP